MKLRMGFVTNSSSSSYIIAMKKGSTVGDIEKMLLKNLKDIKESLADIDVTDKTEITNLIKEVADNLFNTAESGMELDDWMVGAATCNNENGNDEFVIYNLYNTKDTDNVKFANTGN